MKCHDVKEKLGAFFDGELSREEENEIRQHLAKCHQCQAELQTLKRISDFSRQDYIPQPDKKYWASLPDRITAQLPVESTVGLWERVTSISSNWALAFRLAGVAATAAIIFVVAKNYVINDDKKDLHNYQSLGGLPQPQKMESGYALFDTTKDSLMNVLEAKQKTKKQQDISKKEKAIKQNDIPQPKKPDSFISDQIATMPQSEDYDSQLKGEKAGWGKVLAVVDASVTISEELNLEEPSEIKEIDVVDVRLKTHSPITLSDQERAGIGVRESQKSARKKENNFTFGIQKPIDKQAGQAIVPEQPGLDQKKLGIRYIESAGSAAKVGMTFEDTIFVKRKKEQVDAEFLTYDTPPQPIGGFDEIQKNLKYPAKELYCDTKSMVIIKVLIDSKGQVLKTEVIESTGNAQCDTLAINAIKSSRWNPAIKNDKPVKAWVTVPIGFVLK